MARGKDSTPRGPYGPNQKRHKLMCLWCGKQFFAAKKQAKTCSGGHRSQLSRYLAEHGCTPLFPLDQPGARKPVPRRSSATRSAAQQPLPPRKDGAK